MASLTLEPRAAADERGRANRLFAVRRFMAHTLVIFISILGALFAHELGHALIAQFFGARVVMFNVLGMQWYPQFEWMPQLGFGGYVYWWAPVNLTNHRLIVMAGSTTTLLISLFATVALNLWPTRGLRRTALICLSLYFLDSLIKILPILGWLPPGWNSRLTRSFSEAYFAAVGLGMPSELYVNSILLWSVFALFLVWRAQRQRSTRAPVMQFGPALPDTES